MAGPAEWTPSTAEVGEHARKYTRDAAGAVQGDFTASTAISQTGAARAIADVVADMAAHAGTVPDALVDYARGVAAVGAAGLAVADLDLDLSRYLTERYEKQLVRLRGAVIDAGDGTVDGTEGAPATGCFPDPWDVTRAAF